MSSLDSVVSVTVRLGSISFDRAGFGTPLLLGYTTQFPELVKTYASPILSSMEDDGFKNDDPLYEMAQMLLRQGQAVPQIKIGRLTTAYDHDTELTPINTTAGFVYSFTIRVFDRATNTVVATADISFTNDATPTVAEATAGLTTAINGSSLASLLTATDGTTKVTVSSDVTGNLIEFIEMPSQRDMSVLGVTTYSGVATQLDNIRLVDDDWYCLLCEVNSDALSNDIADWVADKAKIALLASSDTGITLAGTTTDIASDVQDDVNDRASVWYSSEVVPYLPCAIAGLLLPTDPGNATWAHKRLRGIEPQVLNGTESAAVDAKNANYYFQYSSTLALTRWGTMGDGYIDTRRDIDWLVARCQEAIVQLLGSSLKVPYTKEGIAQVRSALEAVVGVAVSQGVLSAGDPDDENNPPPAVLVPKIGDVPLVDKQNRVLNNVTVTGTLAGAIHKVSITLQLSE